MARDDDTDDKKTSDKRGAGEGKSSTKAKENGGAKAAEAKKADKADKADVSGDKAARDKAKDKDKDKDKAVKKAKEGKVREADVPAKPVRAAAADHAAHAIPHGHHAPNRKEYWKIFVVLFVLTVIEVAVAQLPGISKTMLVIALVGLALTKAACVAFFYMHLKHETRVLRAYVAVPFAAPAVYALVLIAEAAWRLTR